jgi:hypothetical protein
MESSEPPNALDFLSTTAALGLAIRSLISMSDMEIYRQLGTRSRDYASSGVLTARVAEERLGGVATVADFDIHAPFLKQPFRNVASISVQLAPSSQFA